MNCIYRVTRLTRNTKIIAKERAAHGANDASEDEIRGDSVLIEMSSCSAL